MKRFIISSSTLIFFLFSGSIVQANPKEINNLYKEQASSVEVLSNLEKSEVSITEDDVYLMAQTVFAESSSEPYKGKVAVASVIINRLKTPGFPKTIGGVIKQKDAFSCVKNGSLNVIPDESSYLAVLDALKGNDPTSKAVFFYNPKTATSPWMIKTKKSNVIPIGNHIFFK
jgi:N-acetylmuramoyl-L-alanine amidase